MSEVLLRYTVVKQEYDSLYRNDRDSFEKYMAIIDCRMHDLANGTYMNAGDTLLPLAVLLY